MGHTGDVVDAVVNDDVHARGLVLVAGDVGLGKGLGHGGRWYPGVCERLCLCRGDDGERGNGGGEGIQL